MVWCSVKTQVSAENVHN